MTASWIGRRWIDLSLFFLGSAALMWNGWDIDLDSKTGKITIKRYGVAAKP